MSNFWSIARRNLARNKRRNIATGVATALGFATIITLGGYYNWIGNMLRTYTIYGQTTGHIVIYQRDGLERSLIKPRKYSLNESDLLAIKEAIAANDNIELSGPKLIGTGLIGNGCRSFPFTARGLDPELEYSLREHPLLVQWIGELSHLKAGKPMAKYPVNLGPVILSQGLAEFLGKTKVHDSIQPTEQSSPLIDCTAPDAPNKIAADANVQLAGSTFSGMMSSVDAEVVGLMQEGQVADNTTMVTAPISLLNKLYDTENATSYAIWLKTPAKLANTLDEIEAQLRNKGKNLDIYRWDDERVSPYYTGSNQFLMVLITFIAIISLGVVAFSIFNSGTITVIERSQEIGMMRSLGFTQNEIRKLFIMEIFMLTILSSIGGGIIAAIGAFLVNTIGIPYNPPGIEVQLYLKLIPNVETYLVSTFAILTLTTLVTNFAVRSVSRRNIAELLVRTNR